MKTNPSIIGLAVLIGAAGIASARDEGKPGKFRRPQGPPPKEIVEKFDKDGDGQLSEEERKAMREELRAMWEKKRDEALAKYDADGDGKLSEDERRAMREEKKKEILAKYDKDGDGKLSKEEKQAAREEMGPPPPHRRPGWKGRRGEGGPGGPEGPPEEAPVE